MCKLGVSECDKVGEATLMFSRVLFRRKHLNDAPPAVRLPCKMRRVLSAKAAQTLPPVPATKANCSRVECDFS